MRYPNAIATLALLLLLLSAARGDDGGSAAQRGGRGVSKRAKGVDVAFGGTGPTWPFHGGVMDVLIEKGLLVPGKTKVAGLSGGAWAATFAALGFGGTSFVESLTEWYTTCAALAALNLLGDGKYCSGWVAGAAFSQEWTQLLATRPDAYKTINVAIAMSQLDSSKVSFFDSASMVVDKFASNAELSSALLGTSAIPCLDLSVPFTVSFDPGRVFRNSPVIDGAFSTSLSEGLCGDRPKCIKVASMWLGPKAVGAAECNIVGRTALRTKLYKNKEPIGSSPIWTASIQCPGSLFAFSQGSIWPETLQRPLPSSLVSLNYTTVPDIYPGR
ncbi:hypothetical protein Rsub_01017 [Raphidocelis subcapitata]|uniref:PNPLA domain-containing protein n=1 Tax=Raphidocelis subcapitata TaxID=307507 RepID=A0A2V0NTZ8_9CHLO|nr:hypothetical protein Rsub_01017 [Raphidocelis subcapitata]|eukprot:GBF88305.1 hypothetical protein Rsub_01017 [Raphidocelis subcapitata]